MFGFLSLKEKIILLAGPIVLVLIILFQGWQSNHWRTEAIKEEQLKLQWQTQYNHAVEMIEEFNRQSARLTAAVQQLQKQQQQHTKELNNALQKHQAWSNHPVPNDINRLLQQRNAAH
ncbi:chemotaxis protein [Pasteurellaceae bacterium Pebbles2]|nr:chemotaxis protein [Pasteurellaceae bacterium Pebbles2]